MEGGGDGDGVGFLSDAGVGGAVEEALVEGEEDALLGASDAEEIAVEAFGLHGVSVGWGCGVAAWCGVAGMGRRLAPGVQGGKPVGVLALCSGVAILLGCGTGCPFLGVSRWSALDESGRGFLQGGL